jgi:deoxyribonuclease IV
MWLMTAAPRAALGSHLPVAGALACALDTAERIGAESVQVFVSNPRGWATPDPETNERSLHSVAQTLGRATRIGATGVVVHTGSYVIAAGHDLARPGGPTALLDRLALVLGEFLAHPAVAGLPVLLETSGGVDAYAEDLALLEGLWP